MGDCPIGPQKVDTKKGYNRSDSSSNTIKLLPEARLRQWKEEIWAILVTVLPTFPKGQHQQQL